MDEGLIFEKLILENFGPFKDRQELLFPSNGVMIVYGNNGGGKTSIIRAINYVLYGELTERNRNSPIKKADLINLEAIKDGKARFRIELFFSFNNNRYQFIREVVFNSSNFIPVGDSDFEERFEVRENEDLLGPGQREQVIGKILPQQIARFFIFDGELLQEYRELLNDQSTASRKISESIETILGVPILVNAREDMKILHRQAENEVQSLILKDRKYQNYLNVLTEQKAARDSHEKHLLQLTDELSDAELRKGELLQEARKNESIQKLLSKEELLNEKIKVRDISIEKLEEQSQEMMSQAWKEILSYPVKKKLPLISEEKKKLKEEHETNIIYEFMTKSMSSDSCIICKRDINDEIRSQLIEMIHEHNKLQKNNSNRYFEVDVQENILRKFENEKIIESIIQNEQKLNAEIINRQALRDDLKNIKSEIGDQLVRNTMQELTAKIVGISREIDNYLSGISNTKDEIDRLNKQINAILDKISKECGTTDKKNEISKETARRKLCDKLYHIFDKSIEEYKKYLKGNVENEATLIFKRMIHEDSFEKLVINENYGLDVSLSSGDIVPLPSEGQFHLVSLALIGALHRNAPLQGPIIMDSPIMRLDLDHRSNMIQNLPHLARQIVLLVTASELSEKEVRVGLSSKLTKEYTLRRYKGKTSGYTCIEEIRSTD